MRNPYESDKLREEYLLFHYGSEAQILPYSFGPREALNFPVRCVTECINESAIPENARALDVGCATGRATFELSRFCSEVIGLDYSSAFIECARDIQRSGQAEFSYCESGNIRRSCHFELPKEIQRERVAFEIGDACAIRADIGTFDIVLAANLLCRLPDPAAFLARLETLVNPEGQLILLTPCTWLEEYTPKEKWIGGKVENGVEINTLDELSCLLSDNFRLEWSSELPFLIREHARKYQWSVSQASRWRRT